MHPFQVPASVHMEYMHTHTHLTANGNVMEEWVMDCGLGLLHDADVYVTDAPHVPHEQRSRR